MADEPEFAPPSTDPADQDDLAGVLRIIMGKMMQQMDDCLPATVLAYDRVTNRATVQPQIMMGSTDGQKVSRAQIASVPVFQFGGGGFVMSFPILPGDLGWIKATDRDISLFLQGGHKEEWPNTTRTHSFQDGLFFPDVMRQWTLNAEDMDRAVLQSTNGLVRVALGSDRLKLTAPLVEVEAADTTFSGTVTVAGLFTGNGTIVDSHGIVLDNHKHVSAAPGSPTGTPIA
jgi:hypothetical protein